MTVRFTYSQSFLTAVDHEEVTAPARIAGGKGNRSRSGHLTEAPGARRVGPPAHEGRGLVGPDQAKAGDGLASHRLGAKPVRPLEDGEAAEHAVESRSRIAQRQEEELRYLEGAQGRGFELRHLFRVGTEYARAIRALHFLGPCVTVFGSARIPEGDPRYELARCVGRELARAGYTVMTGGGPGIMEAANRGAWDAGAKSIGLNIALPHEQRPNSYITPELCFQFHYFAIRKLHFMLRARALVAFPGRPGFSFAVGRAHDYCGGLRIAQPTATPPGPRR